MPTYLYETLTEADREPRRFEVFQGMNEAALTVDPHSGEAVRRVVTGGIGIRLNGLKRSTVVNKKSAAATACGCSGKPHRHLAAS